MLVFAVVAVMVLAPRAWSEESGQDEVQEIAYSDVALPPEGARAEVVTADVPRVENVANGSHAALTGAHSDDVMSVDGLTVPAAFLNGTPAVNRTGDDLATLEFPSFRVPTALEFDPAMVQGEWVQSPDDYKGARRLHVQYDFHTVIGWANGETPTGEVFCGSCPNPQDLSQLTALHVELVDDLITLKPRIFSSPQRGVVASNISVRTIDPQGHKRIYQFTAIEISGLVDDEGAPLRRTDYHEVRPSGTSRTSIVPATFEARVSQAARTIEAKYEKELEERELTLLGEKADDGVIIYDEFDVLKKHGRRRLEIESALTIGDETVLRAVLYRSRSLAGKPLVLLESDRDRLRALELRSSHATPGEYKGKPAVYLTLTTEGVVLRDEERLVLSVVDGEEHDEFRAAASKD